MKVLFVGHCTFRLTLADGATLLTDPWFKNNRLWRTVPPALGPDQVGTIHYLLSSHNHLDHIDAPGLALAVRQNAVVIGSSRVAGRARKAGVKNAVALAPGEEARQKSFTVQATPAFHPLAPDAIGFLIRAEGKQIYFSGDTRPDTRLRAFLQAAGRLDLCLLQVACARYFGQDDGLDQRTAGELALALKPAAVIPMHLHARFKKPVDLMRFQDLLAPAGIAVKVMERGEETEV